MVRGDISVDNDEVKYVQGLYQFNEYFRQFFIKYVEVIQVIIYFVYFDLSYIM